MLWHKKRVKAWLSFLAGRVPTLITLSALVRGGFNRNSLRSPYEPPDGYAYFGFTFRIWDFDALTNPGYGDRRRFDIRYNESIQAELSGKTPTLFIVPCIWQNTDGAMVPFSDALRNIKKIKSVVPGTVPCLSWQACTGWDFTSEDYQGITTRTVQSGAFDAYIRQYARDVRAYRQPLFIRPIAQEANGSWNRSCSPLANHSLTTEDYVASWRKVVDIFRQEFVTNVAWVWNCNTFPPIGSHIGQQEIDRNLEDYYPGDGYVDWVGADHYDYDSGSAALWLDPQYDFALLHNKPFFLGEWGVRHKDSNLTPQEQEQWIAGMFDYFESHPRIKAVVYFNYKVTGAVGDLKIGAETLFDGMVNYQPNVNDDDFRLLAESGADFRSTFSHRIANPRYTSVLLPGK